MQTRQRIVAALAAATNPLYGHPSLERILTEIAWVARTSIPGFDHVGVSLMDPAGRLETKAAVGELVPSLDRLQFTLQQGPCVDCLQGDDDLVVAPNIEDDDRWPDYAPLAVELGLRAQMAVKLPLDAGRAVGSLNLYSTSSEDIDLRAEPLAELFADRALIALGRATELARAEDAWTDRR